MTHGRIIESPYCKGFVVIVKRIATEESWEMKRKKKYYVTSINGIINGTCGHILHTDGVKAKSVSVIAIVHSRMNHHRW